MSNHSPPHFRYCQMLPCASSNLGPCRSLSKIQSASQSKMQSVSTSQWAAPMVIALNINGRFRICDDYKVTVNQALDVEEYPLPTPEKLFSILSGGRIFSKLDISQAYLQVSVDEASKPYLTVNTHHTLYFYNRLPFGVASAVSIKDYGYCFARDHRSNMLHR